MKNKTEAKVDDLTALVGSRICHDLISPLGAIGNGLELLQMTGQSSSPELSLISDSVENANARVRFFRIAYGNAYPGQMVKETELKSILKAMYHASRLEIGWALSDLLQIDAKLALLSLQCLETALPYGGKLHVQKYEDEVRITARADRLVFEEDLWSRLSQPHNETPLRPAQVQFGLLAELVQKEKRRLSVAVSDTEINISF